MNRKQSPYHIDRCTLAAGDWLRLEEINYVDRYGQSRTWETANRQGTASAVYMITLLHPSERYVMIRQYRPPTNGYVLEFPAGLVDPGESPENTALRELREETGYTGKIRWIGPFCLTSPGMSTEGVHIAFVDVDEGATANQSPKQMCEEGEDIEVLLRTADELPLFLREMTDDGTMLDSRLAAYCLGLGLRW